MSQSPPPPEQIEPALSNISLNTSRTVAIIKNHALAHRFDIEHRILDVNFEIVKERQMEFDTDSDPDFFFELFGDDASSLADGPVWVYVLERRRSIEVWNTLMGNPDPEIARQDSPTSLRALYGVSPQQNALMGSADAQIAELQIASLFASSPPFPTSELPDHTHDVLAELRERTTSDEGYAPSNPSTFTGSDGRVHTSQKILFRARPLPKTHEAPDIMPRTTRAAALRAGLVPEKPALTTVPRSPLSKERLKTTFANVPGHKRTGTITVASTAPPVVAPRMTRAASLRIGQPTEPSQKRRPISAIVGNMRSPDPHTFEGVPGHKRRESIAVQSVKAPTVAPKINKSAALRASKDSAPPTSYMFRPPTAPKQPGLARSNSQASLYKSTDPRPRSRAEIDRPRPASSTASRPSLYRVTSDTSQRTSTRTPSPANDGQSPLPESATRPSLHVPAIQAPTIAPRSNKSALLRAAKMEKEASAGKPSKPKARALVH